MDIIGIGLPRTGTTSLSAAVEILGYSGSHVCEIHGAHSSRTERPKKYLIDNSIHNRLDEIVAQYPDAHYILTTRDEKSWYESISRTKVKSDYTIDDMNDYTQRVKMADIKKLLVLDIFTEKKPWEKLCSFLNEPVPSAHFPHQLAENFMADNI